MTDNRRSPSSDSLFVEQDDHYNNERATQRRSIGLALPGRRSTHFTGDGFDFRRPVVSIGGEPAERDVIDLTEENEPQRMNAEMDHGHGTRARHLPRFGREIIDIGIDHPRYSVLRRPNRAQAMDNPNPHPLEEQPRPQRNTNYSRQASSTPYSGGAHDTIDLTGDDTDEVVFMEARPRPIGGINQDRPAMTGSVGTIADIFEHTGINRLRARLDGLFGQRQRDAYEEIQHHRHRNIGTNNNQQRDDGMPRASVAINPPALMFTMDYTTPAFAMGYAGANEPPQPDYQPPSAVARGFTRNPEEDEVVVCPNCGDELAVGSTEEKQELWVIRKCGHAYCGDCARNYTKSSRGSKKGKSKAIAPPGPPTFKQCVVDGCKESASGKAFMHVFVGS